MDQPLSERTFPTLRADGKTLETMPNRMGWLQPSDPAEPFETLAARFRQDGYLFLKGFLDRAEVLEQRGHVRKDCTTRAGDAVGRRR